MHHILIPFTILLLGGQQNNSVLHLACLKALKCLVNTIFRHLEPLNNRLNLVQSSKLQHLAMDMARSDKRAVDGDAAHDEGHVRNFQVVRRDRKRIDAGASGEHRQDLVPRRLGGSGHYEARDLPVAKLLINVAVVHGNKSVRTELGSIVLLAIRTGKDDNAATKLSCKLDGNMAETTNAHNANSVVGVDIVQSSEDGSTGTLKRSGILIGHIIGNRVEKGLSHESVRSKAASVHGVCVTVDNTLFAEDILALKTVETVATIVGLVSPAYSVTLLEVCDIGASLLDNTNTFVTQSVLTIFLEAAVLVFVED